MKLSVIIVNYNVKYFLEQCLASVQKAIATVAAEIIVIDNCSDDGSEDYIPQKFPGIQFIKNTSNDGFAKANNKAIAASKGKFILLLNPDTLIGEDVLQQCIAFLETSADAGAVGIQMLDGSGTFLPESKRAFPAARVSFFKLSGLAAIFPNSSYFNRYALAGLDKNAVHEVDVLCGAFIMSSRSLLLQLNGFDERFFMYGEDIDLSYRIQQTGKKNYYLGNLAMIHFKGESSSKNKSRHLRVFYNAMYVFVKKHYTGWYAWFVKFLLALGIALRWAVSFLGVPFRLLIEKLGTAWPQGKKIVLTGDVTAMAEAEKIILKYKLRKSFSGSLLIEKKESFVPVSHAEVIFCTGDLLFKESIEIARKYPAGNKYLWHALHTGSIVGSAHKKEAGIVYCKEADEKAMNKTEKEQRDKFENKTS